MKRTRDQQKSSAGRWLALLTLLPMLLNINPRANAHKEREQVISNTDIRQKVRQIYTLS